MLCFICRYVDGRAPSIHEDNKQDIKYSETLPGATYLNVSRAEADDVNIHSSRCSVKHISLITLIIREVNTNSAKTSNLQVTSAPGELNYLTIGREAWLSLNRQLTFSAESRERGRRRSKRERCIEKGRER